MALELLELTVEQESESTKRRGGFRVVWELGFAN